MKRKRSRGQKETPAGRELKTKQKMEGGVKYVGGKGTRNPALKLSKGAIKECVKREM